MPQPQDEDTFRILVATDNHLGYMEKDPVRGQDSFRTFEEILQYAHQFDVDMILLGGDLFHDNKPSRNTICKTIELFRKYCLGSRDSELEIVSDQSVNFSNRFACANYIDENLNVAYPVFIIHGNHDDPTGIGNYSAIDILSLSGYVNYFGKVRNIDDIECVPILFQKGQSKLALYGLGNIRDERLYRTFLANRVKMLEPSEQTDEWFKVFVVHQNRVPHGPTNYLPEAFISDIIDLVFWGHEHECLIDPVKNIQQEFYVSQPGSSVATMLSAGESKPKHICLLEIKGKAFNMTKIKLQTVRPFIYEEVVLSQEPSLHPNDDVGVNKFLVKRINQLITEAIAKWKDEHKDELEDEDLSIPLPLIRLRVDHSGGFETLNPQRLGQEFVNKVANPNELVSFFKKRSASSKSWKTSKGDPEVDETDILADDFNQIRMEDVFTEYLKKQALDIIPEHELGEAVATYVEKDEKEAIENLIEMSLNMTRETLIKDETITTAQDIVVKAREEKSKRDEKYNKGKGPILNQQKPTKDSIEDAFNDDFDGEFSAETTTKPEPKKRATTKKTTTQSRSASSKPKATKSKKSTKMEISEDDEDDDVIVLDSQDDDDFSFRPDENKNEAQEKRNQLGYSEEEESEEVGEVVQKKRKAPAKTTKKETKSMKQLDIANMSSFTAGTSRRGTTRK